MQTDYIRLKTQILFGCIPAIGGLIVLVTTFINFVKMPKVLDKILLGLGFFIMGAGLYGLVRLVFWLGSDNFLLSIAFGLLIFYYIAFALIGCQFAVFKISEKRKEPPKEISEEDQSKFV